MRRLSLAVLCLLVMLTLVVPRSLASGPGKVAESSALRQRQEQIVEDLARIQAESQDERLLAAYLERNGFKRVQADRLPVLTPDSNSNSVFLPGPSIWYDAGAGSYLIFVHFAWKNTGGTYPDWYDDQNCFWPLSCTAGGPDMWAIHLSRSDVLQLDYQRLLLYDNTGGLRAVLDQPVYNSGNNGAAFEFQDVVFTQWRAPRAVYNADHGDLYLWMKPIGSGQVEIRSRMAHTWAQTSITGGRFSNNGLEMNFSSTAQKWDIQGNSITRLTL